MSILLKVTLDCNMRCMYCYEKDTRALGRHRYYDVDEMLATAKRLRDETGDTPSLHGGECLLVAKPDLERLLAAIYAMSGQSGIQTNATLIDDDHIRMFKKYKTHVGVSIDGPWPLNRGRAGEDMTGKILANIAKLRQADISVGPIVVLSKFNATEDERPALKDFLVTLRGMGIKGGRLNFVECGNPEIELSAEEARECYLDLVDFVLAEPGYDYQPFRDIVDNLCGFGLGTCIFTKCDYYATQAGKAVLGDGSLVSCLKTAKDGQPFLQAEKPTTVRYEILKAVSREKGGCGGCRYWRICYGGCPAEGEADDWRNKTRYCEAFRAVYELIEKRLKALLPNIHLVTDDLPLATPEEEERDYEERRCNRYSGRPFALMTPEGTGVPSTWRGEARNNAKRADQGSQQGACDRQPILGKPGWRHGDHYDASGTIGRQGGMRSDLQRHSGTGTSPGQAAGHGDRAHGDYSRHGDSG